MPVRVDELPTPALCVDLEALDHNIDTMAATRPGPALRPHVKAFKSTAMAGHVVERGGHRSFCCATLRELEGMVSAGIVAGAMGEDLLLANETLDADRLAALVGRSPHRLTVAVDSDETVDVAATATLAGELAVLIDVDVGLPRCGCAPGDAGRLADRARGAGLEVRGVMGYGGHVVGNPDREWRVEQVAASVATLAIAHDAVGGDVISMGGTGTYDLHDWATEVQAGSYLLMDRHYRRLGLPFREAVRVRATVISVNRRASLAVADAGLKAFGMDHGEPEVEGATTFFTSDEHVTFVWDEGSAEPRVGDRVWMVPGHVDPTVAYHDTLWLVDGDDVVESWPVDLRGW